MRKILLVDNGSLRPQAALNLRRLAEALSRTTGHEVEAASLLHSYKIPAEQLEGHKAVSLGRGPHSWRRKARPSWWSCPSFSALARR